MDDWIKKLFFPRIEKINQINQKNENDKVKFFMDDSYSQIVLVGKCII
jgi:hypothetical protein